MAGEPHNVEFAEVAATPRDVSTLPADLERWLAQAEQALDHQAISASAQIRPYCLTEFADPTENETERAVGTVPDAQIELSIEFGRTRMAPDEIAELQSGQVVPLDDLGSEVVKVFADGRMIAKGELVVLNDNFCVRVTELMTGERGG
jgi:flagellar motor switch protein FliN/FliY